MNNCNIYVYMYVHICMKTILVFYAVCLPTSPHSYNCRHKVTHSLGQKSLVFTSFVHLLQYHDLHMKRIAANSLRLVRAMLRVKRWVFVFKRLQWSVYILGRLCCGNVELILIVGKDRHTAFLFKRRDDTIMKWWSIIIVNFVRAPVILYEYQTFLIEMRACKNIFIFHSFLSFNSFLFAFPKWPRRALPVICIDLTCIVSWLLSSKKVIEKVHEFFMCDMLKIYIFTHTVNYNTYILYLTKNEFEFLACLC